MISVFYAINSLAYTVEDDERFREERKYTHGGAPAVYATEFFAMVIQFSRMTD